MFPAHSTSVNIEEREMVLIEALAIIVIIQLLALPLHQLRLSGIYAATSAVVFWQRRKERGLTRCGLFFRCGESKTTESLSHLLERVFSNPSLSILSLYPLQSSASFVPYVKENKIRIPFLHRIIHFLMRAHENGRPDVVWWL